MSEVKYVRLSGADDDDEHLTYRETHSRATITIRRSIFIALVTLQISIWVGLAISLILSEYKERNIGDRIGYYPAIEAAKYYETYFIEDRRFMSMTNDVPTKETDDAWMEIQGVTEGAIQLASHTGFKMDEIKHSITSAVDPRYHLYGLEVYHQLHCLDIIRQSFHPDHYFPNRTEREFLYHREHCLEHLRQSIMCHGDVGFTRWEWSKEDHKTWLKTDMPHVCRDFNSINGWTNKYRARPEDWLTPEQLVEFRKERLNLQETVRTSLPPIES